jgi:hypothetical protein
MAATLQEILLAPDTQPKVLEDCYQLVQQEVSDLSGVSGTAVKLGYKTVAAFMPGHIRYLIEQLVPGLVDQLQPYWADFHAAGGSDFGDYLTKRGGEVAQSLLTVTDARAQRSERPTIIKAYRSVRGSAAKHVEAALPRLGDLVSKYAA